MEINENVELAPYTTLKVGGVARYFVEVTSVDDLEQVRQFAMQTDVPVLILGHGSNVLISDKGYSGVVVINKILDKQYIPDSKDASRATFGSGENWDEVVADTVSKRLWGLENLSHIPGTVGATPVQNVGAYGVEVSDKIVSVEAYSMETGEYKNFTSQECNFGYRDSYFKTEAGRSWCITSVTFLLSTDISSAVLDYADLRTFSQQKKDFTQLELRNEIIKIRSEKFPDWQSVGTAGSFFKNPIIPQTHLDKLLTQYPQLPHFVQPDGNYKVSLGWIIDKVCGLRGYYDGDVCLSEHQALVLLNRGSSAVAVEAFVAHVQTVVYQKTRITIEPEVRSV